MDRIETRTQLIECICERNDTRRAIVRACYTGTVQVLGGFSDIPSLDLPGWIVIVTSVHGRTWTIAVTPDHYGPFFRTWFIEDVPWINYVGRTHRSEHEIGYLPIYDGDNPEQAYQAKRQAELARDRNEI